MSQRTQVVFPSAVRTANLSSSRVSTQGARDLSVDINVTAITGTSVTFTVEGYDASAGTYFTLVAGVAITAAGRQVLSVGPDFPVTANVSAARVLPLAFRITTTGTWNPATFTAVANFTS